MFEFNGLVGEIQIWLGVLPNLEPNLDSINSFSDFCQISDLALSTPKGVGGLPPQGGEVHHPPLGNFLGPKFGPENDPTTAARTAKHMTAVVFHSSSQPKKGDHPWLT